MSETDDPDPDPDHDNDPDRLASGVLDAIDKIGEATPIAACVVTIDVREGGVIGIAISMAERGQHSTIDDRAYEALRAFCHGFVDDVERRRDQFAVASGMINPRTPSEVKA